MRKILLIFFVIGSLVNCLSAQNLASGDVHERFYIGGGRTLTGAGDYYGVMVYSQYNHALSRAWTLAPRLSFAMGSDGEALDPTIVGSGVYRQFSALALDVDVNYLLFPVIIPRVSASLSVGPSVRYAIDTGPTSVYKQVNQTTGEIILEADYQQEAGFAVGATGGVNLMIDLSDRLLVTARASAQVYSNDDIVPFYGLAFGRILK